MEGGFDHRLTRHFRYPQGIKSEETKY
ncbi:hypothetical protein OF001_U30213 [Pseudomonas sp. OF001]|nr:hypothetical protein OF001_U30213 [Pseudomonas sp. OF001]